LAIDKHGLLLCHAIGTDIVVDLLEDEVVLFARLVNPESSSLLVTPPPPAQVA